MSDTTCTIDGCDSPHLARGLCNRHYKVHRKSGDLTTLTAKTVCIFVDCDRPHRARNLCHMHYFQVRAGDEPTLAEERAKFLEEYAFFRSWHMTPERMAERMGISLNTLEKRVARWIEVAA